MASRRRASAVLKSTSAAVADAIGSGALDAKGGGKGGAGGTDASGEKSSTEISQLRNKVKALQFKTESQQKLLENAEQRIKQLDSKLRMIMNDDLTEVNRQNELEIMALQREKASLMSEMVSNKASMESVAAELEFVKAAAESQKNELLEQTRKSEHLSKHCENLRVMAAKYQKESESSEDALKEAQKKIRALEEELAFWEAELAGAPREARARRFAGRAATRGACRLHCRHWLEHGPCRAVLSMDCFRLQYCTVLCPM